MNNSTKERSYGLAIAELDRQLLPDYAAIANKYELSRSTLSRRHQGKQQLRAQASSICRQRLTLAEDASLIGYINKMADRGMPPTASIVRNLAEELIGRKVGKNWTG